MMTLGPEKLSNRQKRILELLIEEGSLKRVAEKMGVSHQAIKNQVAIARERSRANSTYELVYMLATGDLD